jgi:hypothetical protein
MGIFRVLLALALVGLCVFVAATMVAQKPDDKTVGERVDRALGTIRHEANQFAEQLRRDFQQARVEIDNLSTNGRVYARLHWDKTLTGSQIDVNAQEGGVIVLRGTVPNEAAKQRALELARDTVGVSRVTDELRLATAPAR